DNQHTIRGHWEAIEYYLECKKKGIIRSVGFSSHTLQSVKDSLLFPDLDVIHPVVNYKGLGITDGTKEEMEEAVALASNAGKGIYAMKVFGGGRLVAEPKKALDYSINFKGVHSTVIGMQSVAEVEFNVAFFLGRESELSEETKRAIRNTNEKTLKVRTNCIACGKCMPICPTKALSLKNGRLEINKETCVLCGYCGNSCDINALLIQ
ncbi:MAG: 4Fe-4S binding protein, partial [Firmicutes bacterium]|nr:4Fe-4S binding protein [Bacillota bacterium]